MSWKTRLYISLVAGAAVTLLLRVAAAPVITDPFRFGAYLALTLLASNL